MAKQIRGNIFRAMGWMIVILLLLIWLPFFGSLIAGFVGGRIAGNTKLSVMAVFIPCITMGIIFFFTASYFTGYPLIGTIAGLGGLAFAFFHVGTLFIGSVLGGFLKSQNIV